jgi:hypothetical protein
MSPESEGRRQLRRDRSRWDDNIKIDIEEIWYEDLDCVHMGAVWSSCMVL